MRGGGPLSSRRTNPTRGTSAAPALPPETNKRDAGEDETLSPPLKKVKIEPNTPPAGKKKKKPESGTPNGKNGPMMDILSVQSENPTEALSTQAIALFRSVSTVEDFQVIARVFWITASAHRRGQTPANRTIILEHVCKESGHTADQWWTSAEYILIWDSEYDAVIKHYVARIDHYAKQWIASSAGKAYMQEIERRKKAKIKASIPLTNSDVETLVLPRSGNQLQNKHQGISWGLKEVYDIFSLLGELGPTSQVTPAGDEWFDCDMMKLKQELLRKKTTPDAPPIESWYTKLTSVATSTLLEFVYLSNNVPDATGRKNRVNDISRRNILMRVPTPAWNTSYPDFPIDDCSVETWVSYYSEKRPPNPSLIDIGIERESSQFAHAEYAAPVIDRVVPRAERPALDIVTVDYAGAPSLGESCETAFAGDLEKALLAANINPSEYDYEHFESPTSIPLAKLHPPQMSSFVTSFMNSNIYAQVDMMRQLLHQETSRLSAIKVCCDLRIEIIKTASKTLEEDMEIINDCAKEAAESAKRYRVAKTDLAGLEAAKEEVKTGQQLLWSLFSRRRPARAVQSQQRAASESPNMHPHTSPSPSLGSTDSHITKVAAHGLGILPPSGSVDKDGNSPIISPIPYAGKVAAPNRSGTNPLVAPITAAGKAAAPARSSSNPGVGAQYPSRPMSRTGDDRGSTSPADAYGRFAKSNPDHLGSRVPSSASAAFTRDRSQSGEDYASVIQDAARMFPAPSPKVVPLSTRATHVAVAASPLHNPSPVLQNRVRAKFADAKIVPGSPQPSHGDDQGDEMTVTDDVIHEDETTAPIHESSNGHDGDIDEGTRFNEYNSQLEDDRETDTPADDVLYHESPSAVPIEYTDPAGYMELPVAEHNDPNGYTVLPVGGMIDDD